MADDERRGSMLLRPRFLLFCLYIMLYIIVRSNSEIVYQSVTVDGFPVRREHIVGADYSIPRWRRQLYRVFFSPLMVAEEEGRRLMARGEGLVRNTIN